jgi:hypothetical protein
VPGASASRRKRSLLGASGPERQTLDAAYREVGGRLAASTEVTIDGDGKIHLSGVKAVEEPPPTTGR